MTDRWRRLEELFDAACELPPEQRDRFLDVECSGDPELKQEVREMLSSGGGTWVAAAIGEAAVVADDEETSRSGAGRKIGPYRLERLLGEGGMGSVWLAHREDENFQQTVALKLIRAGMESREALARFVQERQLLARLSHPHIARLLDGGTTEDGQHYFAMEYVDGLPLTTWAADRKLGLRARLELFRQICQAVQYSHSHLIVHRDLKPGNILVAADGTVKLLDFGISKLISEASSLSNDTTVTVTSTRAFTPDYGSPEQVLGEPVTTASDIYSLGAVLFALITGEKPHKFESQSPWTIVDVICTQPVRRPSSSVQDRSQSRELAGDLDNIVLKAMRREPERRYDSVGQLWEDVQRYLSDQPVIARPETLGYLASKFVKRHRWGVAAAGVLILSIVAGVAATLREARIADRRFGQVRALANSLVFEVHDSIAMIPGTTKARDLVLRRGVEYLDALTREAHGDRGLLEEIAGGYVRVGDVQGDPFNSNLGETKNALESYRKSVVVYESMQAASSGRELRRKYATALGKYGTLKRYLNDPSGSAETLRKAIALLEAQEPDVDDRLLLARFHHHLSRALNAAWDLKGSMTETAKAVALAEEVHKLKPTDATRDILATTSNALGDGLVRSERFEEALGHYERVLGIREGVAAAKPHETPARRNLMLAHVNVGDVLGSPTRPSLRRYTDGIVHYRAAVAIAEKGVAADPHDKRAQTDLAYALTRLGAGLQAEQSPEALPTLARALRITDGLLQSASENANLLQNASYLEERTATSLAESGQPVAALPHYARSVELLKKTRPSNENLRYLLEARVGWAKALARIGREAEVTEQVSAAREIADKVAADKTDSRGKVLRARALGNIADAYFLLPSRGSSEECQWARMASEAWSGLIAVQGVPRSYEKEPEKWLARVKRCVESN